MCLKADYPNKMLLVVGFIALVKYFCFLYFISYLLLLLNATRALFFNFSALVWPAFGLTKIWEICLNYLLCIHHFSPAVNKCASGKQPDPMGKTEKNKRQEEGNKPSKYALANEFNLLLFSSC